MVPGRGPVKIAAALAVAAAGFGGGFAYKKFMTYLHEKQLRKGRKERRQRDASASEQEQKAVLFVTELLQSLGNGHANERKPRPNRSQQRKIKQTLRPFAADTAATTAALA